MLEYVRSVFQEQFIRFSKRNFSVSLWDQDPRRVKDVPKFLYSPSDSQVNCIKNNFEIYIKIDIKTCACH
jgi:hypothetical protein